MTVRGWLAAALEASAWAAAATTTAVAMTSLALVVLALRANRRYIRGEPVRPMLAPGGRLAPPVTIVVPAHNEAAGIVVAIESLLHQTYSATEIVVVDDGSTDATFDELYRAFDLAPIPHVEPAVPVPSAPVLDVWVAGNGRPLRVVRKTNGGKADSLNAGLNLARTPYVCMVDADSVLVPDALERALAVFASDPDAVAVGGGIGVINGCRTSLGHVEAVRLPRALLPLVQVVEYLRAFLAGRIGWSSLDAALIVSGAFGVFRRDALEAIGGYRPEALGEDLDLVLRLRLHHAEHDRRCHVRFLPETVCFTEVPADVGSLRNQRIRWARGLADALAHNRSLFFHRGAGRAGWLGAPYHLVFELLSPIVEIAGLPALALAWWVGALDAGTVATLFALSLTTSLLLSAGAILLDVCSFGVYGRPRQLAVLLLATVVEQFGYRQLTAWWRVRGLVRHVRGAHAGWGDMQRRSTWNHAPAPAA